MARASSVPADGLAADSLWIDRPLIEVTIAGLGRTRPEVVRRELWHRAGRRVDLEELRSDRDHLLDLGLFAQVTLDLSRDAPSNRPRLQLRVEERPTSYLLPTVDYDPENHFSYGILASEDNLCGRDESFRFAARLGGVREARLSHGRRWTFGRRFGLHASAYWTRAKLGTEKIRETRAGLSVVLSPAKDRTSGLTLNPGWENARSEPLPGARPTDLEERNDHRWFGLGAYQDTRDYRLRATHGRVVTLGAARHGGPLGGDTDFWRFSSDLLGILPTGGESGVQLASRLLWSEGTVPRYLRLSMGGTSTLRGYDHGQFGGESRWIGWVEEVVPLLARRTYNLGRLRKKFDLTIDGSLFCDAGSIWDGDALARGRAQAHFSGGAGLRFLLPLVQLVRIEFATNGRGFRIDGSGGIRL